MADLSDVARLVAGEQGLSVVSTLRADGTIQSSVVNAGVLGGSGEVAFVVRGGARKLDYLRERPQVTVVVRVGWEWVAVEGRARLVGPDDADPEELRLLLREIFTAAGGTHEDFDEFDRVMRAERRTAVLVAPSRVYSN
ncbi:TIGR03618 family F420-dependent PPOX class oxidoreductase [Cryptosporangium phraense]|uniref:TIGR03618 family F420-dependent PPOX class oxidoreductase n=1 Tax=Cryptosporangium phraense TaxID=2593070 RepID=A0A545ADT4_9ACTN|nr:TIGR03618 family F420-dependent PPOX class oxidoreductase [Cryptosporangium phraense]TQS39498.1 TIGR03618 family F420-dependent PPOX class oxidoreductase [Cryptosporangium phraense]